MEQRILLATGSPNFNDFNAINDAIESFVFRCKDLEVQPVVVTSNNRGADTGIDMACALHGVPCNQIFVKPDPLSDELLGETPWHGRQIRRASYMVYDCTPDEAIIFDVEREDTTRYDPNAHQAFVNAILAETDIEVHHVVNDPAMDGNTRSIRCGTAEPRLSDEH